MSVKFGGIDCLDNELYELYVEDQKVGWAKVRFDLCSIMDIFVDETLRNRGYGRTMVHYVEQLAAQKDCVVLRTNPINPEAKRFFEKCDYKIDADGHGRKTIKLEW